MALYAYKCSDCGLENDFIFKMGEAPTEFDMTERTTHHFVRVYTSSSIITNPSGDGYFFNKKTGLRSSGRGKR